ncbi:nicotinamidase, putative [Plasmodium malariae]|uniref:nicotinamidase n=1 Tax=Plasmodium malariae TaxID=5858 RepID=A0A1D3PB60_PLAMA|nr:nicotinamidase, putative [Plasmodium malariae]SCN12231.1 nicotinamidase, putative [Plasmodium malariae]
MKCLVIVDAQNDFLPKGAFNSKEEYMDALYKINSIRLNLFNCSEKDLLKLRDCKNVMEYKKDLLLNENIVEYYKCCNDIDAAKYEDEILLFPFDKNCEYLNKYKWVHNQSVKENANGVILGRDSENEHNHINSGLHKDTYNGRNDGNNDNNSYRANGYNGNSNGKENYLHHNYISNCGNNVIMNSNNFSKECHLNGLNEKTNKGISNFTLHILSVDYHPQLHVSFAKTHRIIYEEICKNSESNSSAKANEYEQNEQEFNCVNGSSTCLGGISNHIDEEETNDVNEVHVVEADMKELEDDGDEVNDTNTLDDHPDEYYTSFLKKNKIFNLTDVLKNIKKIKKSKIIYKNVNSVNDIKEYNKLNFLNKTIDVWPIHCVRNTLGCKIHKKLIRHIDDVVIKKADTENHESLTIFENDKVNKKILNVLKEKNINSVYICGFIFEYCVKETALSFLSLGFDTYIIEDATAYLFGKEEDKIYLKKKGIKFVNSSTMFL